MRSILTPIRAAGRKTLALIGEPEAVHRITRNIGWLLGDKGLTLVVGLTVGVWVARHLGPGAYGTLSYTRTIALMVVTLSRLGLDQILLRDIVAKPTEQRVILGTATILRLIAGIAGGIFLLVIAMTVHVDESEERLLVIVFSVLPVLQALQTPEKWFDANVLSFFAVLSRVGGLLIATAGRVLCILTSAPLVAFAVMQLVQAIAVGISYHFWYSRQASGGYSQWRISKEMAIELMRRSWPLLLASAAVTLHMRIDVVMIQHLLDESAVGLYTAAVNISEVSYVVPVAVLTSVTPALIRSKNRGFRSYDLRLRQLLHGMVAFCVPLSAAAAIMSTWVISLLYGPAYAESGTVLAVHAWSLVFVGLGVATSSWLINEGYQIVSLYRAVIGTVTNIVLNLVLIPRYGIIGAAWATVVSFAVADFISMAFFGRKVRYVFWRQARALILADIWHWAGRRFLARS